LRDLVAIGPIQSVPIVLTVAPKTPATTYAEYVALAKAKGGQLSVASAGNGSSNHLAIELLMRQANLKLLHVPYKGSGPALTDLTGSHVESMMDQLTASIGHIREGRIRVLAISSLKRSPLLPEVPTLDELGVKGYEAATFTGIFAPAGISPQITEKLSTALRKAMANESVRSRYRAMGVEVMDLGQPEFAAYVRADYQKWLKVARERQARHQGQAERSPEQYRDYEGRRPRGRRHCRGSRRAGRDRYHRAERREDHPGEREAAQRVRHAGQQIRHHRLDPQQGADGD